MSADQAGKAQAGSSRVVDELREHEVAAIVVGSSAGAVEALLAILPELPASLPVPVLIVVHVPRDRPSALPELFARRSAVPVLEAEDKIFAEPGTVYFAPSEYHLLVERGGQLALSMDEPVNLSRPSIDVLFESAAYAYGTNVLGIVLSGANADGTAGLKCIRRHGGLAWVQTAASAKVATMPLAALAAEPHAVLSPGEMVRALATWAGA